MLPTYAFAKSQNVAHYKYCSLNTFIDITVMRVIKPRTLFATCICLSLQVAIADDSADGAVNTGVLDAPLPGATTQTTTAQEPVITLETDDPQAIQQALREELADEQEELVKLPRPELQQRAENGERAAQVTLAEDFAKEAAQLAFAPDAANDALSDAVRWYSTAASRGFPGAPSLDQAGVHFYPVRVHRSR